MAKKHTEKFDPTEIPLLLERAKNGDIKARDELVFRFQRLIANLVNVCITGRPNLWSTYQKSFLKLFAGKSVSLQAVASMLKKELSEYEKEELFITGQLAVMLAIEKCETNLATTIVYSFKDLIYKMIKDPTSKFGIDLNQCEDTTYNMGTMEDDLTFNMFLETLSEEEAKNLVDKLDGKSINISTNIQNKFKEFYLEGEQ